MTFSSSNSHTSAIRPDFVLLLPKVHIKQQPQPFGLPFLSIDPLQPQATKPRTDQVKTPSRQGTDPEIVALLLVHQGRFFLSYSLILWLVDFPSSQPSSAYIPNTRYTLASFLSTFLATYFIQQSPRHRAITQTPLPHYPAFRSPLTLSSPTSISLAPRSPTSPDTSSYYLHRLLLATKPVME